MALRKIAFKDIEKVDIIVENITDSQIYAKYKPNYIINLGLYCNKTGSNIVYMLDENVRSGYLFSPSGLGITKDNKILWCDRVKAYNTEGIKDYCSFSPTLISDGKIDIDWGNRYSSYVDNVHYRSFIGIDDNNLYLGASDYRNSIKSLVNYCLKQGMKYAGNNDGGGSVSLWENGKAIKKSSRRNASWLLVWLKDEKQNPPKQQGSDSVSKHVVEIQSENIEVDGKDVKLDTITLNGKTFIEMRELAQILDRNVGYDAATRKKSINRK